MRGLLLGGIVFAIACGSSRTDPGPQRIRNVAAADATIRTCALATPKRTPIELSYRKYLGRIGDRTWVLGERGDHTALITLDDAGRLAIAELPVASDLVTTVSLPEPAADARKARIWLVSDTQGLGKHAQTLYPIDVDGARVTVGAAESLANSPHPGVSSFAVSKRRALFFTFAARAGFQLWDRERVAAIGPAVPFNSTEQEPPAIRCVGDACFAIGVVGDGSTRRISVIRFDERGAAETEALADDHLSDHLAVPVGERTLVLWTAFGRRGLYARELDAHGRPAAPERLLAPRGSDPQLVGGAELAIAFVDGGPWRIAKLAADRSALAPGVVIGLDDYLFVLSGSTGDGTLSVGIDSGTDYDGSIHSWSSHGDGVWTEANATRAEPPIRLWERSGGGYGGFAGFPLVTPRHAAALAVGGDVHDGPGELVLLREPCR